MEEAPSLTRVTLLARLTTAGTPDQAAWTEFVEHYGGKVYRWCRRWGLQEADASDVAQQVLLKLAQRMRTFVYDPERSFRAWLKTVTRHALLDFESSRAEQERGSGSSQVLDLLARVEVRADLERRIEEEYERELLAEAMRRVQQRVAPHTWEAFRLTAIEGVAASEAAARLDMRVGTVYQARSSVTRMLAEERQALEKSQDSS